MEPLLILALVLAFAGFLSATVALFRLLSPPKNKNQDEGMVKMISLQHE